MKKHKDRHWGESSFVQCGRCIGYMPLEARPNNVVRHRKKVTCKNCLRHRPKRKGK